MPSGHIPDGCPVGGVVLHNINIPQRPANCSHSNLTPAASHGRSVGLHFSADSKKSELVQDICHDSRAVT